jgi:hypothetical protein
MPGAIHCVPCCSGQICSSLDSLDELIKVEEFLKTKREENEKKV